MGDWWIVRERRFDLGRDVRYEKYYRRYLIRFCCVMLV